MKLDYLPTAVTACGILHNICEVHDDEFDEQWMDDVNFDTCSLIRIMSAIVRT